MKYPYLTLDDETEINFSDIEIVNGKETIRIHIERPRDFGFDTARCAMPNEADVDPYIDSS